MENEQEVQNQNESKLIFTSEQEREIKRMALEIFIQARKGLLATQTPNSANEKAPQSIR